MADAIRKDQQTQNRSQELALSQEKEGVKTKTSTPGTQAVQANTRTVGKKTKAGSPIPQVRKYKLYYTFEFLNIAGGGLAIMIFT